MSDTILISTHRLELAGRLREAFREEGYAVDLAPTPDQLDLAGQPSLVVLTGERNGDGPEWARAARRGPGGPLVTALPGADARARGRALGADEAFPADPDPGELVFTAHKLLQRRRLQETTGIIGETEPMHEVLERIVQIAPVESTVLVSGESGTGKELVARGIHQLSPRRHRAFLAVNVAALTDTLLESELFGHEKGAFTGAIDARRGFFELADRGTLFLDEIGEMPLATQTKLLRVLEQREFMRVGGEKATRVDVRIIAATNQDLRARVADGEFRRDLYYRLNILSILLPPLRERRDDVPVLIGHFVRELSERLQRPFPGISSDAMEILKAYDWPGNVRELRNLVESMVVLSPGKEIGPQDLPAEIRSPQASRRLLPVPYSWPAPDPSRGAPRGGAAPGHVSGGAAEIGEPGEEPATDRSEAAERAREGRLRPELEFVFRTLMELRMDMDQLRREFEAYREDVDDRIGGGGPHWTLPAPGQGIEVGVQPRGRHAADHDPGAPGPEPAGPDRPADSEERSERAGEETPATPAGADTRSAPDASAASDAPASSDASTASSDTPSGPDVSTSSEGPEVIFRPGMTMEELEEEAIRAVLRDTRGNRRRAAESLGIGERTLYRKIKKYDIEV